MPSFLYLGVPVRVVEDHGVGGGEVDAQPTRTRREEEAELLRAWRIGVGSGC